MKNEKKSPKKNSGKIGSVLKSAMVESYLICEAEHESKPTIIEWLGFDTSKKETNKEEVSKKDEIESEISSIDAWLKHGFEQV
jgi:hypothetical protein